MNDEINVSDVVSYIQFLKKEKDNLMDQVKDINLTLQKIKESLKEKDHETLSREI